MSGRLMRCVFVVSLVGLMAGPGYAQLEPDNVLGAWLLDEGNGDTTADASGNGHEGTLMGSPGWVAGNFGNALEFDGTATYVDCGNADTLNVETFSVSFWCNIPSIQGWNHMVSRGSHGASGSPGSVNWGVMMYDAQETILFETFNDTAWTGISAATSVGEWHHLVATYDGDTMELYHDGALAASQSGAGILLDESREFLIGARSDGGSGGEPYIGRIDEVGYFDIVVTVEDIEKIMTKGLAEVLGGSDVAIDPQPAHGDIDVPRDCVLGWTPGMFASTHNVYIGTVFEEVDAASVGNPMGVLASENQTANTFDLPGVYDFGQTYFWRVDEVNGTPDKTVFRGGVWSFTAEPYSIQIPGSSISVIASSFANDFSTPENTINGSGLGADNAHTISSEAMWFTAAVDLDPWIQYEFDSVQKLETMRVWNSNSAAEMAIGWGVKDVEILYSTDGEAWTVLEGTTQFSRAPGNPSYNAYDEIDFGGIAAKLVRLNIATNWGGLLMSYSLSEVQFAAIPAAARTPEPASGSMDVVPNATVAWRAGREAAQHTLYVSADANAVADGSAPSATSNTNSYDLTPLDLDMGTTYYWRVDEVNEAEAIPVWAGPVWSMSTAAALIVDDFESYGNASPDRPFQTWLDGFGYSSDEFFPVGYPGNGTGAGIGHDIWSISSPHYDGDIMETITALPGSNQSMPFYYTNSGGVASHTDRMFASPQDWTVGAAITLSIPFRGQVGNTGTLYVVINGVKVVYPHDAADIARAVWQAWNIDLSSVSTDLQSVTTLSIGVDGSGASGLVLIDDITLHAEPGEVITPVEPGDENLVLYYAFDEGSGAAISDSSGNGYSGTFESIPAWATGVSGSAISLDGVGSYIDAPAAAWSSIDTEFTVSFWAQGDAALADNWGFYAGDASGRLASSHLPWGAEIIFDATAGWADERVVVGAAGDELRGQWRHWTMVRNSVSGEKRVYIDGVLYGTATASADPIAGVDRFFIGAGDAAVSPYMGLIDDFQIYNRALSQEEVLWNAGVTTPIDKPF